MNLIGCLTFVLQDSATRTFHLKTQKLEAFIYHTAQQRNAQKKFSVISHFQIFSADTNVKLHKLIDALTPVIKG